MSSKNKRTLILTSIVILLPILIGILLWNKLPDSMATHFNFDNAADGYREKWFAVIMTPFILLALHLIMAMIIAADPRKKNISSKVYGITIWIIPATSLALAIVIYPYNLGIHFNISLFIGDFVVSGGELPAMMLMDAVLRLVPGVLGDITITSLWVIRVARVVPAYRWTGVGIRCGVGAWSLNPTLWHIVVAECVNDRVISSFYILWITIRTLHCRYTRSNALLLVVCLFLLLYLIHTLSIVLLTSRYI